jgi:tetratricopeptide (TPR) repeat protein
MRTWFVAIVLGLLMAGAPLEASDADERAYALNREGMIAMSEARFTDAIDAFQRASQQVSDYGILGRPLIYTPVFMTGWASEKIGAVAGACEAYRKFLDIAPQDAIEETKADHAAAYLAANCRPPDR